MIHYEDFAKLELKVGKVVEASAHPNADKLYVLKVDIGERVIQVVAGVKRYYQPDELVGLLIAVLTNLEPRVVRGIESQGMLLAAQSSDTLAIIGPHRAIAVGSGIA